MHLRRRANIFVLNKEKQKMQNQNLRKTANTIRILYPLWMIVGMFSLMYIPSQLMVNDDPVLTAQNIADNTTLFRVGIVTSLITQLLFIIIPIYWYRLYETIDKNLAIWMLVFSLISVPMCMYNEMNKLAALSFLDDPKQLMFYLKMNAQGIVLVSIFWGLWLFPLGKLAIDSGFFPKLVGWLLYIGGIGYLISSLIYFVAPELEDIRAIAEILTMGEVLFILWFLVKGVNIKNA